MIKITNLLTEGNDKVYVQQNTLAVYYRPNSGTTTQLKGDPDKFRGFFTDKRDDSHYDHNVVRILDWTKSNPAIVKKGGTSLYKIPAYWGYTEAKDLSVWGGSKTPDYYLWMLVQTMGSGDTIINFFKTKSEALAFWQK